MRGNLIIGGRPFQVSGAIVLTWNDHGVQFCAGEGHNKRRVLDIDLCVWHWTGGENEPLVMVDTLRKRKLGVEFAISREGVIYQFCDPLDVDTADAGWLNGRSVGVEVVNYGVRSWKRGWLVPKRGRDRATYEATIQGGPKNTIARFYPAQLTAVNALARALSSALAIPRQVPRDSSDLVVTHQLPLQLLAQYRGHLGHSNIDRNKRDPGPELLQEVGLAFRTEVIS